MRGKGKKFGRPKLMAAGFASLVLWVGIAAGLHGEVNGSEGISAREENGAEPATEPAAGEAEASGGATGENPEQGRETFKGGESAAAVTDSDHPPEDAALLEAVRGTAPLPGSADLTRLAGARIAAGKLFSLRGLIGEQPGEAWNYPASLLHEAAVKTGIGVAERHVGLTLTEGAKPGFEALVSGTSRDLLLYNGLGFDVWIEADTDGEGIPEFRLVGVPPEDWEKPAIEVETEWFPPGILVLTDGGPDADYEPSWTGREGLLAKVYQLTGGERKLLYKDFYPPLPVVEIHR